MTFVRGLGFGGVIFVTLWRVGLPLFSQLKVFPQGTGRLPSLRELNPPWSCFYASPTAAGFVRCDLKVYRRRTWSPAALTGRTRKDFTVVIGGVCVADERDDRGCLGLH